MINFQNVVYADRMKTWPSREREEVRPFPVRLTAIQSKKREEIGKQRGKASMVIGWFVHADRFLQNIDCN